jgi:hypothetical protein
MALQKLAFVRDSKKKARNSAPALQDFFFGLLSKEDLEKILPPLQEKTHHHF